MRDFLHMGNRVTYGGECFDSLTEARWAMYFDARNMPYEYEQTSYELIYPAIDLDEFYIHERKRIYTPDFYLPEQDTFVEVKRGNADEYAATLVSKLARTTGKMALLIDGHPRNFRMNVFSSADGVEVCQIGKMNKFWSNFFFNHHMLMFDNNIEPKQLEDNIELCSNVFDATFYRATEKQIAEKLDRRNKVRNNPVKSV